MTAFLALIATATAADLNGSRVFYNGAISGYNFRIPAIVQAEDKTLVAFAEARHGGDSSVDHIAFSRSTDSGMTWSNVTFAAGATDSPAVRKACAADITACRVGNPAAVYDAFKKRIIVIFAIRGFQGGEDAIGMGMVTSSDSGMTFSKIIDLSVTFGAANASMPGPGTALQLRGSGKHAGRLLLVSHHGAYQRDYVTYSDDHGTSWKTINQTFPHMDEAALTQLPNGSVLLNMRHTSSPKTGRAIALSRDDGQTFTNISYDSTLESPVCQASIVSFDGATYFSNPASTHGRNHLTIRKSVDNAATWSGGSLLVQEGNSAGYSCLVRGMLPPKKGEPGPVGGILYEDTKGGISFARFPLAMK